jgi:glycerol kinase
MADFVISIDQGTTGTRAVVMDRNLDVRGSSYMEFRQIYPKPGWVEHNPIEIWDSTVKVLGEALGKSGVDPKEIAGIGITNQRETTTIWDRRFSKPIYNSIVWQCRRTGDICAKLRKAGREPLFKKKTGLVLDPYFSGTKAAWILDQISGAEPGVRHHRLVADLEADRGRGSRHGRKQRIEDADVQHSQDGLGR